MYALYKNGRLPVLGDKSDADSYTEIVREMCGSESDSRQQWRVDANPGSAATWLHLAHVQAQPPEQGWKLHVSATTWSAETVLRCVLPVLLAEVVCFKVAASPEILTGLNDGTHGNLSQIGKFVTIYPDDDEQAVRLAVALDDATRGQKGPPVPSDRALRQGSCVHYRYGGFEGLYIQTPIGEITPAVRTPSGELVPDVRSTSYRIPDWAGRPVRSGGRRRNPETTLAASRGPLRHSDAAAPIAAGRGASSAGRLHPRRLRAQAGLLRSATRPRRN